MNSQEAHRKSVCVYHASLSYFPVFSVRIDIRQAEWFACENLYHLPEVEGDSGTGKKAHMP